ncbi:hypothetical protein FIBSPDRAFT_708816, partial [Athelia psychrophila]
PADFFTRLLESEAHSHYVCELFVEHSGLLLAQLSVLSRDVTLDWARKILKETYSYEMLALSNINAGLQFRASKANAVQVAAFSLEDIAAWMRQLAPTLWELLGMLLSADTRATERRLE